MFSFMFHLIPQFDDYAFKLFQAYKKVAEDSCFSCI